MKSNLKSKIVTVGMLMLLLGVAMLAWEVLTVDHVTLAAGQIQPDLQIAAQP